MEFLDLKTQQKRIRKPLEKRINNILDHGAYIMGPEVFELEEKLADYCGVKHAISCSSGTDALLIPLMAWGIGSGDAVFTTPFTYVATAEVISILGATPVFVDVYESTYNIDCEKLENLLGLKELGSQVPWHLQPTCAVTGKSVKIQIYFHTSFTFQLHSFHARLIFLTLSHQSISVVHF